MCNVLRLILTYGNRRILYTIKYIKGSTLTHQVFSHGVVAIQVRPDLEWRWIRISGCEAKHGSGRVQKGHMEQADHLQTICRTHQTELILLCLYEAPKAPLNRLGQLIATPQSHHFFFLSLVCVLLFSRCLPVKLSFCCSFYLCSIVVPPSPGFISIGVTVPLK